MKVIFAQKNYDTGCKKSRRALRRIRGNINPEIFRAYSLFVADKDTEMPYLIKHY